MKIPYGRQDITKDDIKNVVDTLSNDYLTQGPKVKEFEEAFASYVGAKYAVGVSNGTAALHLSALSLGVDKETKVITSPITFTASANCIRYCGGHIEFADIDRDTYLLSVEACEDLLKKSSKGTYQGIIPVDFAGLPVDMEQFKDLALEYDLWLIEDACHAPGGRFLTSMGEWSRCGSSDFADLAIFSFHPVKHIASGEGGMITTNDKKLFEKLRKLRSHGIIKDSYKMIKNHGGWYYEMHDLGYNYRLTDIQCSLALSQLNRAKSGLQKRKKIAEKYDSAFTQLPVKRQMVSKESDHAYHLYVIEIDQRKGLYEFLHSKGIYVQVHYIPVHMQPYYQELGVENKNLGNSESYYNNCLSLPMYPSLTEEEQDFVIEQIKLFFN